MPLFELGQIVSTPGALAAIEKSNELYETFLRRHRAGDWGLVDREDMQVNNEALKNGYRLLSAYRLRSGEKIWIITEADRSSTTILLPDEY